MQKVKLRSLYGERLCSWKWRKAGRIGMEKAVRVYLNRFIADLPLRGSVIDFKFRSS